MIAACIPHTDRQWLPGGWRIRRCHRITLIVMLSAAGYTVEETP